jgi:hypothetical protein
MKRLFRLEALWILAALSIAGLSACVVAPDQRHYADGLVMVAPPAPQVEIIGAPPRPEYVWVGGYWKWVAGHWAAPRPGYHWVGYEWIRQGDGWRLRRGHWQRS